MSLAATSSTAVVPTAIATSAPALVAPAPIPDPATRLPGGAAALAPLPPGIPFRGHLLITDRGNGRIVEITPDGEMTWSFPAPGDAAASALGPWDDAYYAPDGSMIAANSDPTSTVIGIDIATRTVRWRVGTPGRTGKGTGAFNGPDDSVPALDGTIYLADIRNCRIVRLSAAGTFLSALGNGSCVHRPPTSFASPNGAFPTSDGDLIITEIGGGWIDRIGPDGTLRWAIRAPVVFASDAVPYPDGSVLVADYVTPGKVLRLAPDGTVLWRFDANGRLWNPSIAIPLAANRVAISDDFGNRVLVVDPTTNEIVREYTTVGGVHLKWVDSVHARPD